MRELHTYQYWAPIFLRSTMSLARIFRGFLISAVGVTWLINALLGLKLPSVALAVYGVFIASPSAILQSELGFYNQVRSDVLSMGADFEVVCVSGWIWWTALLASAVLCYALCRKTWVKLPSHPLGDFVLSLLLILNTRFFSMSRVQYSAELLGVFAPLIIMTIYFVYSSRVISLRRPTGREKGVVL